MAKDGSEKVDKAIKEAEKGLLRMQSDLTKAITLLKQDKFTEKKAKVVAAKSLGVMSKHKGVTKLQASKGFSDLPEETQEKVVWIDKLMNEVLGLTEDIPRYIKLMKKSPDKDFKLLSKQSKVMAIQVKQPPKHVGVLVKEVKKGLDAEGPNGGLIALMPMLLLLWMISDAISRGLRSKP